MVLRWILRLVRGQATRAVDVRKRSYRKHTLALVQHPVRTVIQTTVGTVLLLVLFVFATNPEGLQAVAASEAVSMLDIVGLFPGPIGFGLAVAAAVVLTLVGTVLSGVSHDLKKQY
ncbi:hypothetical protein [Haloarchaeobius sp. HME9146]|uniref:hypothetical protein n=1 Tax=Haloarchaeobius sp. HME9146 TaxID=2978732 RepID=UPI0021C02F15|nr:hypothetical protein [Haloarchaeobius sp. HME9146]MCT9097384.1 hypothetical protein [Haloarchaeobius sp. HME9146]